MQEMWVWSLGWEDPLEEEMATYLSILAWEIPWTGEPCGLHTVHGVRVGLSDIWLSDWAQTYIQLSGLKQHPCIISQFPWLRNLGTVWLGPLLRFLWRHAHMVSRVRLFAAPWTVAHQAPLSMWFSRQEYWSGLPFSSSREQNCISCVSCIGRRILHHRTTWESSGFHKAAIRVLAGTRTSSEAPSCLLRLCACSPNSFSCCSRTHGTFFFKASRKENLSSSSLVFQGRPGISFKGLTRLGQAHQR